MARVGLSKPYVALYEEDGNGNVTYSGGIKVSKAVETHVSLNDSGDNELRADNDVAETANEFSGGTLNVITDELPLDAAAVILGLTVETVTLEGEPTASGKKVTFGQGQNIPHVGYGVIAKKIVNGASRYMAVILRKVQFANPGDDYVTQGKTISWQTPSLSATIMREDTAEQEWRDWVEFEKEAHAEKYIKQFLNIADVPEG